MRYITGIDLKNVVPFAEVSVDIKLGLTYIRGLNYDSDPTRPSSNGAGKSRLVSSIANVFYQAEPTSKRKNSKKEMLSTKQSSIGIIFKESADADEHEIIQMPGSYSVYKGGEDIELATIPKAEDYLRKLFPLTEREFYTRVFVSTRREYPLQNFTNAERLSCFVECFHLDQYSLLQNHFSKIATSIKSLEVKAQVLEQQKLDLSRSMAGVSNKISASEAKKAASKAEEYTAILRSLEKRRFAIEQQKSVLENLLETEEKLDKLRKKYKFRLAPAAQLAELKQQRKIASAWESYESEYATYARSKERLDAQLKDISAKGDPDALEKEQALVEKSKEKFESLVNKLTSHERQRADLEEELSDIRARFKKFGVSPDSDADYAQTIAECKTALSLKKLLDAHSHEDGHVCPTCLSEIDFENIRKTVKSAEKQLAATQKLYEAQKLQAEGKALAKKLQGFEDKSVELADAESQVVVAEKALKKIELSLEAHKEKKRIVDQLSHLSVPKKPNDEKPDQTTDEIEAGIELCSSITTLLSTKQHAIKSAQLDIVVKSSEQLRESIAGLASRSAKLGKEHSDAQKKAASYADVAASFAAAAKAKKVFDKQLASIDTELEEMRPKIEEKQIVDALVKVYGAKGLRAYAANKIAKVFEANLNHYRDLIFFEPFQFSVQASDTGLAITVDRNNGKPNSVSDVRNLSGAESNCFVLLCVISQIALVPDSLRTNLLVLDEPTSHMCEVTRRLFNESYLPELQKMVPSVLVISPHGDDNADSAYRWVIEKRNGTSTLIEG